MRSPPELVAATPEPTRLLRIEGYTDGSGTREQNLSIGEKRARFVMKYLMSKGVEAARITIASYGVQLLVKER
jgi:outer membrane protein OmpA-like peptidoglycan-associated protein